MARRKGRAARKQQREKAAKADERGLPKAEPLPKPQKTRKVGGDTALAAVESERSGRSGPKRSSRRLREPGFPVVAKVAIGAAFALLLLYALSTFRKSESFTTTPDEVSPSDSSEGSSEDSRSEVSVGDEQQDGGEDSDESEELKSGAANELGEMAKEATTPTDGHSVSPSSVDSTNVAPSAAPTKSAAPPPASAPTVAPKVSASATPDSAARPPAPSEKTRVAPTSTTSAPSAAEPAPAPVPAPAPAPSAPE